MDLTNVSASDILTIIALVVAVVIGARGGIQRSTIGALKEQNDAYERREIKHQQELDEVKADRAAKDQRTDAALKRLGDRNQVLEELVLKRAETAEIVEVLKRHDSEAAVRHEGTLQALTGIQTAINEREPAEAALLGAIRNLSTHIQEVKT